MARSIDTIQPKRRSLPVVAQTANEQPAASHRSAGRGLSNGVWLVLMLVGGFFLITRPTADADTTPAVDQAQQDATVAPASDTRLGPPQPSQSASLEETVILDSPLPTSRDQTAQQTQTRNTTEQVPAVTTSYTVRILNGTTTTGLAAQYESKLKQKGVSVSAIGTAVRNYSASIIYFTAGHRAHAEEVQSALGWASAKLQEDLIAKPADVLMVVGNDHAEGQ